MYIELKEGDGVHPFFVELGLFPLSSSGSQSRHQESTYYGCLCYPFSPRKTIEAQSYNDRSARQDVEEKIRIAAWIPGLEASLMTGPWVKHFPSANLDPSPG